ncbi:triosephosphate isomerase [Polynucleobacter sp. SHI8]|uniref:triose-phosphate isomerase n=1 Tax=unclassified Polynucleobacter TaxID=2640945 RepID=UPI002492BC21|nr:MULTISPECIES: triose-phosphate isomerase [unclassified Polynucleobacter]BDW10561.1 triosephosphate isomerase [Polynucleobacter sp. SHI2]BDW13007.1 triosephosphate isomerase [Polynucleobacter sp. SHI8]
MRPILIIANWKLNGNWSFNEEYASAFSNGLKEVDVTGRQIVICPPSIYLQQLNGLILDQEIYFGGQDLSDEISGAFTGEISGVMLKEFGCRYVLVGHSERRVRHQESNEVVVKKALNAIAAGLIPVVCVGETLEQRQALQMQEVLSKQVDSILQGLGEQAEQIVLAYEPIWAIGTGQTASAEQAQEVHGWLRETIGKTSHSIAENLPIIYGGSVKSDNAKQLLEMSDIDGLLVGGASLVVSEFLAICQAGKVI